MNIPTVIKKTPMYGCEVSTIKLRFEFETLTFDDKGRSVEGSQYYSATIEGALKDHEASVSYLEVKYGVDQERWDDDGGN